MSAADQAVSMIATLRLQRKAKGLSFRSVGRRVGVSKSLVCAWEHGQREPSPLRLIQWAEALDFDVVLRPHIPQAVDRMSFGATQRIGKIAS